MKAKLQIAHQVPGRIRMKIPSARGHPELLAEIERSFGAIPGIVEVVTNAVTGSVVLKYDVQQHDDFRAGFNHHFNEHHAQHTSLDPRPPATKIDAFVNKIEEEADF